MRTIKNSQKMSNTNPKVGMSRWRAQVRKFIFVAPQRKLWFSKAQLRSLRFKLLDETFNRNFFW